MAFESVDEQIFGAEPVVLAANGAVVIDCHGCATLTIITDSGATATYSRVDAADASAHTSGSNNGSTLAASSKVSIPIDWPYFRVSVSGGACRVAAV